VAGLPFAGVERRHLHPQVGIGTDFSGQGHHEDRPVVLLLRHQREARIAYGDLFQYTPKRREMKSVILASHLSPDGEELLFNCFGPEYLSTASKLLTLDWLHAPKVTQNLARGFNVQL